MTGDDEPRTHAAPPPGGDAATTTAGDGSPARSKPSAPKAFVRFATVGASGVLVNLGVLWVVLHGPLDALFPVASAIATEAAILWNYAGNELWTYHLRRLSLRRLAKFNAAALAALALTVTVASLATEVLLVAPLLAQLAGIAAGSVANFAAHFGWIWRR